MNITALHHTLQTLWARVRDSLWPPLCLLCQTPVCGHDGVCPGCWPQLPWIRPGGCSRCGLPLAAPAPDHTVWLCGPCHQNPGSPLARGRSVLAYTSVSQSLVLGLKTHDKTWTAPVLASWMARAGQPLKTDCMWMVPVPLHWTRLMKRGFNQSALLGLHLSRILGLPCLPVLRKKRPTASQGTLSRKGRAANVRGAFGVRSRYAMGLKGRPVLLVDDVWTTGATLESCAQALKAAGSGPVSALTLARVAPLAQGGAASQTPGSCGRLGPSFPTETRRRVP
jgi:ComF family protein